MPVTHFRAQTLGYNLQYIATKQYTPILSTMAAVMQQPQYEEQMQQGEEEEVS